MSPSKSIPVNWCRLVSRVCNWYVWIWTTTGQWRRTAAR